MVSDNNLSGFKFSTSIDNTSRLANRAGVDVGEILNCDIVIDDGADGDNAAASNGRVCVDQCLGFDNRPSSDSRAWADVGGGMNQYRYISTQRLQPVDQPTSKRVVADARENRIVSSINPFEILKLPYRGRIVVVEKIDLTVSARFGNLPDDLAMAARADDQQ